MTIAGRIVRLVGILDKANPGAYKSLEEVNAYNQLLVIHMTAILTSTVLSCAAAVDVMAKDFLQPGLTERSFGDALVKSYGLTEKDRDAFAGELKAAAQLAANPITPAAPIVPDSLDETLSADEASKQVLLEMDVNDVKQ
jgi:acetyl-CoA acetyltransferase